MTFVFSFSEELPNSIRLLRSLKQRAVGRSPWAKSRDASSSFRNPGAAFPEPDAAGLTCPAPLLFPLGSFPFSLSKSAGTGSHHTSNIARQGWAIWFEKQNKINITGSNLRSVA